MWVIFDECVFGVVVYYLEIGDGGFIVWYDGLLNLDFVGFVEVEVVEWCVECLVVLFWFVVYDGEVGFVNEMCFE